MVIMMQRPGLQATREDELLGAGQPSDEQPSDGGFDAARSGEATAVDTTIGATAATTAATTVGSGTSRRWLSTALVYVAAAAAGVAMAMITVFNLHILAGLYEGWAATPAQVLDHSTALAVVDVVILVGGPVLMVVATWWVRRRLATGPDPVAGN